MIELSLIRRCLYYKGVHNRVRNRKVYMRGVHNKDISIPEMSAINGCLQSRLRGVRNKDMSISEMSAIDGYLQ